MKHFINAFKLYGVFSGRSTRQEYWMFTLVYIISYVVLSLLVKAADSTSFTVIFSILTISALVPTISITARRLHDVGRSGWWQVSPYIGMIFIVIGAAQDSIMLIYSGLAVTIALSIYLLVLLAMPSDEDNQYGTKPQA